MRRVRSPDGDYFKFGTSDVSAEAGEPIQPRHAMTINEVQQGATSHATLRGAVLRSARYRPVNDFTPLIPRAYARSVGEPAPSSEGGRFTLLTWHPTTPLSVRQVTTSGADSVGGIVGAARAELVFYLGQYHPGRRTERVYDAMTLDEVYSDAADHTPPTVVWVRGKVAGGEIDLAVNAADDSGIARVVIAHTDNGGTWHSTALDWAPALQHWAGRIPDGTESFVQLADWAGNVAVDNNGGRYYTAANLPPPSVVPPAASHIFLPLTLREQCRPQTLRADVVLVLDLSTSMDRPTRAGRSYLDAELDAGRQFLDVTRLGAPDGDRVAVVGFNSSAWAETGLTTSREVADLALSALHGKTGHGSRLDLGLLKAAELLTRDRGSGDGRTPVIIALTDGNVSGTTEEAVRAAARAARGERIRVYTIGLGDSTASNPADRANRVLLAACASAPEMYYEQPDAEALGGIYRQIAGTIGCMSVDFWGGR